ncbi:MAG: hypothetical protein ACI9SE_003222 [Neolewinella sp.]|jgi:hypothetical protein
MKSLWLKDRPWMWAFAIVGAISMALAASHRGFVSLFVLGPERLEVLFYVAACVGLLLGAVAVLWDDCLGTRELLKQRPVAPGAMAQSPIVASVVVLLSCMVTVPLLTWLMTAIDSGIYDLTFWAGLPEILSTMQIVWPACAIGCLAAAMPTPWWSRLVIAAALTFSVALAIDLGTERTSTTDAGHVSPIVFALACVASAVVLFRLAAHLNKQRGDADQPWSGKTRLIAGSVLVVSFGYSLLALVGEAQAHAVSSLSSEYPAVVEVDSAVQLAVHADRRGMLVVADDDHVAIGEPRPTEDFVELDQHSVWIRRLLEIDAPRFHRWGGNSGGWSSRRRILVAHDGHAWVHDADAGVIHRTGIGPDHRDFPSSARLWSIDDIGKVPNRRAGLVGDRASGEVWRYHANLGYFVSWPLPNGDRFVGMSSIRRSEWSGDAVATPSLLLEVFAREQSVRHIEGKAGAYVLKDEKLLVLDMSKRDAARVGRYNTRRIAVRTETHGNDPMTFTVEVPAHDGVRSFRHEFAPRTATEMFYAGSAMSLSLVRPPLTQLLSSALADDHTTQDVWLGRLVCGGKRLWLLFLGFGVAVGGALLARRRLRQIGASPSVCRFWLVAGLVAGPIASLLAVVCESARNHARPVVVAPPLPRIVSVKKEIRA